MMPVMIDVKGRPCTVVGGGCAAYRKAKTLLANGAVIRVISPELSEKFNSLDVEYIKKEYSPGDIKNSFIVVAATNDSKLNRQIGDDVRNSGNGLFLSADDKDNSDMMFMAYTEHGDIKIAVSTSGAYPALSSHICSELSEMCEKYDKLCGVLSHYRKMILEGEFEVEKKHELIKTLVSEQMLSFDNTEELKREAEKIIYEKGNSRN
ncbi:MAG: hypothetical protein MR413_04595 [Clostridia bacterium]|nr:hypothetical protein [Clostridia bacterium]